MRRANALQAGKFFQAFSFSSRRLPYHWMQVFPPGEASGDEQIAEAPDAPTRQYMRVFIAVRDDPD
jgi:hypothetical protein